MAGPFTRADFSRLVPEDKRLHPDWVKSLTARGAPAVYRGDDLEMIGMPVGGLCAGQVYLGGDGRLWHWDIFNQKISTGAEHYARPLKPRAPFQQGFGVRIRQGSQTEQRALVRDDWSSVSFTGQYPIGTVQYEDSALPLAIELQAYSPFIPHNTEDSSLPATILKFTLTNIGKHSLDVELAGWLENAVCLHSATARDGFRRNRVLKQSRTLLLECSAGTTSPAPVSERPDIPFDDFERENYGDWTVTGTAFGKGPVEFSKIPSYQGDLAGNGKRAVNTHAAPSAENVTERDAATGTLTSKSFVIERRFITFLIGGGAHKGRTCANLVVGGKVVRTSTGQENNAMRPSGWDVGQWEGQSAQIQIVDSESGPWGNIGIDEIVFSDRPAVPLGELAEEPDFGTMCLGLLDPQHGDFGAAALPHAEIPGGVFAGEGTPSQTAKCPFNHKLMGSVTHCLHLKPGTSAEVSFVITWHFPNLVMPKLPHGRFYGQRFASASAVLDYVSQHFDRLSSQTRLWCDTWYDSTLPHWFLDRTFLNTSILASSTCYRFGNGRFYAWEGVGCCEGTCGHVWQYAHAVARLFPDLERDARERVDFGLAQQKDGAILFRGEFNNIPAIDSQTGAILRALREHQMSADDGFLRRNWRNIKLATEWLIAKDGDGDGIIAGNQHNTLDTDWFGPVAWLSGLYQAALMAAAAMADIVGDSAFAEQCREILAIGQKAIVKQLFDGDYFINKPDPARLDAINSGTGCHIDQVFGQSWAFQVGLPRVLPEQETLLALKSLWRYNFTPDVGPYRDVYKPGRWYAMAGEAGLLMCTFPRSDWDYAQAKGKGPDWAAGYFNECMNGFEYQVASHMLWEGMLLEGLAVTRAVHDRYHPARRNPFNEVECGDHYARSMASYGVFLAACGYRHSGPDGFLSFAPKTTPDNFRSPFTTAQAWGTFSQERGVSDRAKLEIKFGQLFLKRLELPTLRRSSVKITVNEKDVLASVGAAEGLIVEFPHPLRLKAADVLEVVSG